jgi:protein-tyrosine-phosphatase
MSDPKPLNVLFLGTGNDARSIIAEAIMNREGQGRFRAYSAGSYPQGKVNPHTLKLLESLHYPTDGLQPRAWNEFATPDAPVLDFVFIVSEEAVKEAWPEWPGHPLTVAWAVPDPTQTRGTEADVALAFADTYRMLNNRIDLLMNLPLASLDRLALRQRLEAIGRTESPSH